MCDRSSRVVDLGRAASPGRRRRRRGSRPSRRTARGSPDARARARRRARRARPGRRRAARCGAGTSLTACERTSASSRASVARASSSVSRARSSAISSASASSRTSGAPLCARSRPRRPRWPTTRPDDVGRHRHRPRRPPVADRRDGVVDRGLGHRDADHHRRAAATGAARRRPAPRVPARPRRWRSRPAREARRRREVARPDAAAAASSTNETTACFQILILARSPPSHSPQWISSKSDLPNEQIGAAGRTEQRDHTEVTKDLLVTVAATESASSTVRPFPNETPCRSSTCMVRSGSDREQVTAWPQRRWRSTGTRRRRGWRSAAIFVSMGSRASWVRSARSPDPARSSSTAPASRPSTPPAPGRSPRCGDGSQAEGVEVRVEGLAPERAALLDTVEKSLPADGGAGPAASRAFVLWLGAVRRGRGRRLDHGHRDRQPARRGPRAARRATSSTRPGCG